MLGKVGHTFTLKYLPRHPWDTALSGLSAPIQWRMPDALYIPNLTLLTTWTGTVSLVQFTIFRHVDYFNSLLTVSLFPPVFDYRLFSIYYPE